jgi:hypothetical protein
VTEDRCAILGWDNRVTIHFQEIVSCFYVP